MQLVEGKRLSDLIPNRGMPLERIFEIAIPLADALAAAHEKGVIHRDLKPGNIMVTDDGRVKVLDFGLAKLRPELDAGEATALPTEPLTDEGRILGTVPYMSPEQLEGKEIDARSDIFSLGDHPPRDGRRGAAVPGRQLGVFDHLLDHQETRPSEIDAVRSDLPHHLAQDHSPLPRKGIPEQRIQTALDVRNELEDLRREEISHETVATPTVPGLEGHAKRRWWLAAAAVLVLLGVTFGYLQLRTEPRQDDVLEPKAEPPKIVILPFENLGPPEDEYFADGLTEEIISRLAAVKGLRVISRTTAMQYKGERPPLQQIGEQLGVEFVLEGSVRWARGDEAYGRVRITPQLIRVEDDTHLWATSYDEVLDDIFAIQTAIARAVVEQFGVSLADLQGLDQETKPTDSIEAYQAYLKGVHLIHQPEFGRSHWEAIVQSFQRAVALDSEFALAHGYLAQAHAGMVHHGHDVSPFRRRASQDAAEKALALAPDDPRVLYHVGFYYYHAEKDYDEALTYFERAARGLPNDADPIAAFAYVQRRLGRYEEGVENLKKAFALSPRNADFPAMLCQFLLHLRRYEEAVPHCNQSIALFPGQTFAFEVKARIFLLWKGDTHQARTVREANPAFLNRDSVELCWLERDYPKLLNLLEPADDSWFRGQTEAYLLNLPQGQVLELLGERDLARDAFEKAQRALEEAISETPGDARLHSSLGLTYAALGKKAEAIQEGTRGAALMPISKDAFIGDERLRDLAKIYVMVGEPEAALEQLEVLLSRPCDMSVAWLRLHPAWDPLRDHPHFEALLEKYEQAEG